MKFGRCREREEQEKLKILKKEKEKKDYFDPPMVQKADLLKIQGRELTYAELCKELNIPVKNGTSKRSQITELQNYCELETNKAQYPIKYTVLEVYPRPFKFLSSNEYQFLFEAVVYQAFVENKGQELYLSNTELLLLFKEINQNFSYTYNKDTLAVLGEEYLYMADMGKVVYKILRQWAKRNIQRMDIRGAISAIDGFRLYSKHYGQHGPFVIGHNVKIDSGLHKKCLALYNEVVDLVMPKGWAGEWVGEKLWAEFEKAIQKRIHDEPEFNHAYYDLKKITVIYPPTDEWINKKLIRIYKELKNPDIQRLNEEACHKIMSTTQLKDFFDNDRRFFIDTNIIQQPKIDFKAELKKIKKEKEKGE